MHLHMNKIKLLILILIFGAFLRIYGISNNPPSMFGDELDLGYQAYSILKTGRDYQGNFMPLNFHSLAEWRTPLYLYSAVPTVAVFGITPLGVRLPAVIFGILGILAIYFFTKYFSKNENIALISALLLAISPWHLQYSRAGFEVTEMIFVLLAGLAFFLKSLDDDKYLWVSVALITLTPWIYSTAKFFALFLLLFIFLFWFKEIVSMRKHSKIKAVVAGLIVGLPLVYGIFFGGATQRFNYISVFSDPTTEPEIGALRTTDARARGEDGIGISPSVTDRLIHNKYTFWGERLLKNYLQAFSTEFLFIKGDPNPRQSVGLGEMYRIEIFALIGGLLFLLSTKSIKTKYKVFLIAWLLFAPIPAALTRDGGNHATRNILMLPPLMVLVSLGWYSVYHFAPKVYKYIYGVVAILYLISMFFFAHEYVVHYPTTSERWWHYGWGESIKAIKDIEASYDRVIISMTGEPAWIFFAAYYNYDPRSWQTNFPIGNDINIDGFGKVSHIGKFAFGSPDPSIQIYGLGKVIDSKTLYLANAKEVGENLVINPQKTPEGLRLVKSIAYPSGEPAFYLFEGKRISNK